MGHLMGQHRRQLIPVALEPPHQGPVDADVIGGIAGSIEVIAVIDAPQERQGIGLQGIIPLLHQLLHDFVHYGPVMVIPVLAIGPQILDLPADLGPGVIAQQEHALETGLVGSIDPQGLSSCRPGVHSCLHPGSRQCHSHAHQGSQAQGQGFMFY